MSPEGDRPGGLSYVPQFAMQAEGAGRGRTAWVLGLVGVAIGLIVLVIMAMHGL
jgi:threonine/homoserine/homoserine lactone efflux protein